MDTSSEITLGEDLECHIANLGYYPVERDFAAKREKKLSTITDLLMIVNH